MTLWRICLENDKNVRKFYGWSWSTWSSSFTDSLEDFFSLEETSWTCVKLLAWGCLEGRSLKVSKLWTHSMQVLHGRCHVLAKELLSPSCSPSQGENLERNIKLNLAWNVVKLWKLRKLFSNFEKLVNQANWIREWKPSHQSVNRKYLQSRHSLADSCKHL